MTFCQCIHLGHHATMKKKGFLLLTTHIAVWHITISRQLPWYLKPHIRLKWKRKFLRCACTAVYSQFYMQLVYHKPLMKTRTLLMRPFAQSEQLRKNFWNFLLKYSTFDGTFSCFQWQKKSKIRVSHSIFFQYQTRKKNWFRNKPDFLLSSNLIFTACVACKNQVRTRQKIEFVSKSILFEFVINSQIDISKIKHR